MPYLDGSDPVTTEPERTLTLQVEPKEAAPMKFDLVGVFAFLTQLQDYEAGKTVTLPLDVSAEFPKATGTLSFSKTSWSISISATL